LSAQLMAACQRWRFASRYRRQATSTPKPVASGNSAAADADSGHAHCPRRGA
jgi:hypothetical protein